MVSRWFTTLLVIVGAFSTSACSSAVDEPSAEGAASSLSYTRLRVELTNAPDLEGEQLLVMLTAWQNERFALDSRTSDRCIVLAGNDMSTEVELIPGRHRGSTDREVAVIDYFTVQTFRGSFKASEQDGAYDCSPWMKDRHIRKKKGTKLFEARIDLSVDPDRDDDRHVDFMRANADGFNGLITCDVGSESCSITY